VPIRYKNGKKHGFSAYFEVAVCQDEGKNGAAPASKMPQKGKDGH
jgi:hypothetical protein